MCLGPDLPSEVRYLEEPRPRHTSSVRSMASVHLSVRSVSIAESSWAVCRSSGGANTEQAALASQTRVKEAHPRGQRKRNSRCLVKAGLVKAALGARQDTIP